MSRGSDTARPKKHVEKLLDRMAKDSFPASDPPQVEGFTRDGEPASARIPRVHDTHAPPPDVGELPGADRSPFDREQRYPLGATDVLLSTHGNSVRIELGEHPLTLDAAALEALIGLLEKHRPSLHGPR
jgi:hypothetical protein